jgi:hypothetical protein
VIGGHTARGSRELIGYPPEASIAIQLAAELDHINRELPGAVLQLVLERFIHTSLLSQVVCQQRMSEKTGFVAR